MRPFYYETISICKYSASGSQQWAEQFGTPETDFVQGISAGDTAIYIAGYTDGVLPGQISQGDRDSFVGSYNSEGNQLWISQFGTASSEQAYACAADSSGVCVTGSTDGEFPGQTMAGDRDIFVQNYDEDGTQGWCLQFGTIDSDYGRGIATGQACAYVAGNTMGTFPEEPSEGSSDAYIARIAIDYQTMVSAVIDIDPDTLNLKSKGKWITCYIELPEGYDVADINLSTVILENTVYAEPAPAQIGDYDGDGIADLMVKFDRQEIINDLEWEWEVTYSEELTINLSLNDGTVAEGSDIIKVLPKKNEGKGKGKK